jgi:hypothetical protein
MISKTIRTAFIAGVFAAGITTSSYADDDITIGAAVAFTGWEAVYDNEGTLMAKLWIAISGALSIGRDTPSMNRANPSGHKGCAAVSDAAFAQARTSAEADHNRQARLLRRRQAQGPAEGRASLP